MAAPRGSIACAGNLVFHTGDGSSALFLESCHSILYLVIQDIPQLRTYRHINRIFNLIGIQRFPFRSEATLYIRLKRKVIGDDRFPVQQRFHDFLLNQRSGIRQGFFAVFRTFAGYLRSHIRQFFRLFIFLQQQDVVCRILRQVIFYQYRRPFKLVFLFYI